jgi:iron-sulfur cluster assembly accessory protein
MFAISEAAVPHLEALIDEEKGESLAEQGDSAQGLRGFRVWVEKGGCAGLQYGMKIDTARPGDSISVRGRARVFVDEESLKYLAGAELDYCDDLTGTGYRVVNPNAARSCGCGTSFEPASADLAASATSAVPAVSAEGNGGQSESERVRG